MLRDDGQSPSKVYARIQTDLPIPIGPGLNEVLSRSGVNSYDGRGRQVHRGRWCKRRMVPGIGDLGRELEAGMISVAKWKLLYDGDVPRVRSWSLDDIG